MIEALLLVDVLKDFHHEDGDALLECYRRRHPVLVSLLSEARARGVPVVYANDRGEYAQPGEVVREAVEEGKAGELVAEVAPANGEPVLLKDALGLRGDRVAGPTGRARGREGARRRGGDGDVRLPDRARRAAFWLRSLGAG